MSETPQDVELLARAGRLEDSQRALQDYLATYAAGFHIDDEDLEGLTSVAEAVDYVAAKLQVA